MRLDPHSLLYAGAVQRTQGTDPGHGPRARTQGTDPGHGPRARTQGTDPGHGPRRMHNVASLTSEALCRHHPAAQSGGRRSSASGPV
jgi:hypothetical protein